MCRAWRGGEHGSRVRAVARLAGVLVIPVVIRVGGAIGLFQGSFVTRFGVPSFVVTLAGLIACQGVIILWIGTQGTIGIQDKWINDTANYFLPKTAGWVLAAIVVSGFALSALGGAMSRRRAGLEQTGVAMAILRVAFIAVVTFGAVGIANHARGVPFAGLLVVALLALWTFVARRTTFGRHVYAVGGSAEAARRAGINVAFIRIAVFMISSGMAVLGGIAFAARLNSVDLTAGGGPILLNAIAAAVIGGTSLFGGRGRVGLGAARRARDHDDRQRPLAARLERLDPVHHHRRDLARGGHARHGLATTPRSGRTLAREPPLLRSTSALSFLRPYEPRTRAARARPYGGHMPVHVLNGTGASFQRD